MVGGFWVPKNSTSTQVVCVEEDMGKVDKGSRAISPTFRVSGLNSSSPIQSVHQLWLQLEDMA